jgi:hypothetical protein
MLTFAVAELTVILKNFLRTAAKKSAFLGGWTGCRNVRRPVLFFVHYLALHSFSPLRIKQFGCGTPDWMS